MIAKVIMPFARTELNNTIRAHILSGRKGNTKDRVDIVSLYKSLTIPEITRQHSVYISNTCSKVIKPYDTVYLLAVEHPILMAMLSTRISNRMRVLHPKTNRRWYILWYNTQSKKLQQYYLP